MIYYGCPKCQGAMASPDSLAGQAETCPACGNVAVVPAAPLVAQASRLQSGAQPQVSNLEKLTHAAGAATPDFKVLHRRQAPEQRGGSWVFAVAVSIVLSLVLVALIAGMLLGKGSIADRWYNLPVDLKLAAALTLGLVIQFLPVWVVTSRDGRNVEGVVILTLLSAFASLLVLVYLFFAIISLVVWLAALIFACVQEAKGDGR